MPEKYQGNGYSFLYPETWSLEEYEDSEAINLETPGGAFISISNSADLEEAFQLNLQMMENEYDNVESEPYEATLAGRTLRGITQRFVYLDLIVTSHLIKCESETVNLLIQVQGEDRELEQLSPVIAAVLTSMCQSL